MAFLTLTRADGSGQMALRPQDIVSVFERAIDVRIDHNIGVLQFRTDLVSESYDAVKAMLGPDYAEVTRADGLKRTLYRKDLLVSAKQEGPTVTLALTQGNNAFSMSVVDDVASIAAVDPTYYFCERADGAGRIVINGAYVLTIYQSALATELQVVTLRGLNVKTEVIKSVVIDGVSTFFFQNEGFVFSEINFGQKMVAFRFYDASRQVLVRPDLVIGVYKAGPNYVDIEYIRGLLAYSEQVIAGYDDVLTALFD